MTAGAAPASADSAAESSNKPAEIEVKAVAAAPLAFRALWAIIVRFFKGLFSRAEAKNQ